MTQLGPTPAFREVPPIPHGGRLIEAMRLHPGAPRPFIDLSTGINPHPYPFTPPPPEAYTRLPEPEQLEALEAAAARAYGVADPAMVIAAPGTSWLIQLLPRLFPQPRIAIPGPTYAEHEAAWRAAGTRISPDADALLLCNPNNPDGARHDPAHLAARARTLRLLVIDESYADLEPALSLAPHLPLPNTVLLRSFGKTYGLPGLRLGFALAPPALAAPIRAALPPWPLPGPAIAIATQALSDPAWLAATRATAAQAATRLDHLLTRAASAPPRGTTLFRLATWPDAPARHEHLARSGLLTRAFHAHPTHLRLGLPPTEQAWSRLESALLGG